MDVHQQPTDQLDQFYYTGDEINFENLTMYRKQGFHPIALGDVLPKPSTCVSDASKRPRYRIMHKLGFGAFATGWLARGIVQE